MCYLAAALSDEFEGDGLDESKWDLATTRWRGRQPGLFDPSNVVIADGHLQLWARAAKRNSSWPSGYDNFTTSTVRSFAAVKEGYLPSKAITHSYVFLADVLRQPKLPEGHPKRWGRMRADYEMDPEIVDQSPYQETILDG